MHLRRRVLVAALSIVGLAGVFLATQSFQIAGAETKTKSENGKDVAEKLAEKPKVSIQKAEQSQLTDKLIYTAQVLSQMESVLPAEQSGMISDLRVNLGDHVQRGLQRQGQAEHRQHRHGRAYGTGRCTVQTGIAAPGPTCHLVALALGSTDAPLDVHDDVRSLRPPLPCSYADA